MWETSLEGDLRPRRRFFDESHLRLTKVTWQSSVQGNWPPSREKNVGEEQGWGDRDRALNVLTADALSAGLFFLLF